MPQFAANVSMMFTEVPFPDRFAAVARAGFDAVEFLFPYDHAPEDVARWLKEHQLKNVLFNMPPGDWAQGERGMASLPGRETEFRASVETALTVRAGARNAAAASDGRAAAAECRPRTASGGLRGKHSTRRPAASGRGSHARPRADQYPRHPRLFHQHPG